MLKKKLRKVINIFQWLLTAVLVLVVLLLIFTTFNPIKSFQIFRVMSGSMEPAIKVGSVAFVQRVNPEILKEGDIITYTLPEDPSLSITHRLIATEEKEGKTVFKTRGDANNAKDIAEVSPSQIKGKVVFSLPFLGYLSVWIRKPLGFSLLVILPALLIIISEILNIKKTIEKEVEKKYAKQGKHPKNKPINLLLIFFLLGISLFQIKPTNAYFSDVVVIEGNTFSMASDWALPPTPTPASVVINEVYYDVDSAHQSAGTENHNEWIELYNAGPGAVDISGWIIEDDGPAVSADIIPSTPPIPADTFVVITPHSSTWSYWLSIPSGAVKIVLTSTDTKIGNGLNNQSDRVILKDNNGIEVDAVSWGTDPYAFGAGNGLPSTGPSKSIARETKGVDTDSPDDWGVLDDPNPGTNPHPPDLTEENKEEENKSVLIEESSATPTPSPIPTTEPTPTPSPTPETSPTPTPTAEPSPTPVPSTTPTPSPSPEPSPTVSPEPSPTSTPISEPSSLVSPTPTPTPTAETTTVPPESSSTPPEAPTPTLSPQPPPNPPVDLESKLEKEEETYA